MTSQFQVLNKILQTGDYSVVSLNNLTDAYFFNFKNEFNFIKNHYDKYNKVPDKATFLSVFPDFDFIDVNEPDSYLIDQLYKDYNTSYLASQFNNVKKFIEDNQTDKAVACYLNSVEKLQRGSAMTCTDLFQDTSRFDHYVDRVARHGQYYISTGFKELDDIIGGIDIENENMVIAARTGVGKSWTLLNIAAAAVKQGLVVGIYSGEMSVDKVGYRVDTLLGNINNKVITRGTDTSVKQQYEHYIKNLKNAYTGTIKVLTPNDINGPATVSALRTFIRKEHLNILLIDQYSLLEDESHAKAPFERVANISKAVKNLQVMERIPIISVSQMNRTTTEDKEQDTTQIGLSDRIGQDATCVIMLSRELLYEDKEKTKVKDDRLVLNIVKSRDGGNGKLVYHADFNTGRFIYLDPDRPTDASEFEPVAPAVTVNNDKTQPF